MSAKLHLPLIKVIVALLLAYGGVLALHLDALHEVSVSAATFCLLAGALYTHLFEYLYHMVAMHHVFRFGGRRYYDKRHLRHHQIFGGENFRTRNPAHLDDVATHWYTLPTLFFLHYPVFLTLFPGRFAPWFFLGVTLQSLAYEVTHWFTHVHDNAFDRLIARLPLLSRLRAAQVRHHWQHHAVPAVNFNFTPPYLGDRCGRTFSK
jgi:hypothetical protein